jgi:hypothetical protein
MGRPFTEFLTVDPVLPLSAENPEKFHRLLLLREPLSGVNKNP